MASQIKTEWIYGSDGRKALRNAEDPNGLLARVTPYYGSPGPGYPAEIVGWRFTVPAYEVEPGRCYESDEHLPPFDTPTEAGAAAEKFVHKNLTI